jgi:hypothetical protein
MIYFIWRCFLAVLYFQIYFGIVGAVGLVAGFAVGKILGFPPPTQQAALFVGAFFLLWILRYCYMAIKDQWDIYKASKVEHRPTTS